MNPAQTQISIRAEVVPCYVRGQANTARIEIERSASDITLTSATYSLLDNGGQEIVASASATVAAGTATYALTTVHLPSTTACAAGWLERWVLVYSSQTYQYEREVAIGRRALVCPVSDTDLARRYARIAAQAPDGITWQDKIEAAWGEVLARLISMQMWPQRILSPQALQPPVLHLTLALVFEDLAHAQANRGNFLDLAKSYRDRYEAAMKSGTFAIDADDDGIDDAAGERREGLTPAVVLRGGSPYFFGERTLSTRGF